MTHAIPLLWTKKESFPLGGFRDWLESQPDVEVLEPDAYMLIKWRSAEGANMIYFSERGKLRWSDTVFQNWLQPYLAHISVPARPLDPSEVENVLVSGFLDGMEQFRLNQGSEPTAAVWVMVDDQGKYRVGWNCKNSALPGTAVLGMALSAFHSVLASPRSQTGN